MGKLYHTMGLHLDRMATAKLALVLIHLNGTNLSTSI